MSVCTSSVSGRRKVRYSSESEAWSAVTELEAKYGTELNAYFCFVCFRWHLGKTKPKQPRDEILVGILIGILRGTYKGSDLVADSSRRTLRYSNPPILAELNKEEQ
jgi:hypothetical protein